MSVKRVWHGWTTHENAGAYENLLYSEVIPSIEAKNIPGYRSIELWRRELEDEVEFITVMSFDSLDNVIDFQGEDYERSYVPEAAQKVLKRWDKSSSHFETREQRLYD